MAVAVFADDHKNALKVFQQREQKNVSFVTVLPLNARIIHRKAAL